jgi:hypothetical protein
MELLKVFVGDGTNSSLTATVANMAKGDLLLLKAKDYTPWVSADGNVPVVIAGKNDKGVYYSAPITNANVIYANHKLTTPYTPEVVTFSLAETAYGSTSASSTYSLGIQIKEDLRMGTYNKNTEVIASHTTPPTATSTVGEVSSTLAKGFSANPLTSQGSPYQLVKVVRTGTGTVTGLAATVTPGARQVTFASAHGRSAGQWVSLDGAIYQIEVVNSPTVVTLDTAYQGTTTSLTSGAAQAAGTSGHFTAAEPTAIKFVFSAIPQTQQNRYDQFRLVEFDVIAPKGWTNASSIAVVTTQTVYPSGSYRQVRDLEEKAHTNSMPLINYREFPFEVFPLNANPANNDYNMLTITYNLPAGYNYMQSSSKEFPQTVVVCSPNTGVATNQFDSGTTNTFANKFNAWFTGTIAGDALPDWAP